MHISSVWLSLVFVLGISSIAWAQYSVTVRIEKGLQAVVVPVRSNATTQDLARITSSPVVIYTQDGRFRVWVTVDVPLPLNGAKGYIVSCPSARTVTFTGGRWGAGILRVSIPRGIELVVNHRADPFTSVEEFRASAGLTAIARFLRGSTQLEALAGSFVNANARVFDSVHSYGLIASTTGPTVVLPNTDESPVARSTSIPLSVIVGTRLGLVEHSTDSDDDSDVLTHTWRLISAGTAIVTTHGSSVDLAFTSSGAQTLEVETSDGLLSHRVRSVVNVFENTTPLQAFTLSGGDHDLHAFGIHGTLPAVADRLQNGVVLNSLSGAYRIAWDPSTTTSKRFSSQGELLGGWRSIDLSAVAGLWTLYPEPTWPPRPPAWPVPFTAAVDMGSTTTGVWDSDVLTEIPVSPYLTATFFNFTQLKSVEQTKTVGQSIQRVLNMKLLPRLQRIAPVSLVNRLSNQVGYQIIEEEDDALPDDDRPVVLNIHGYDFRSEFCGVGELFLASQQRWDGFFGRLPTSPQAIRDNLPNLKKHFKFCRAIYSTTRSLPEIARGLRDELERTLFANGKERKLIIIGYSMGGLIARRVRNTFIDSERIGANVFAVLTIGTPHHGASFPTALQGGLFNHLAERLLYVDGLQSMEAFLPYGSIPPSPGLRSLAYDASIEDYDHQHVSPSLNPELTRFNTEEDYYRDAENLYAIAGGTSGAPLANRGLEIARVQFQYRNISARGFSDGLVVTQSGLPMTLARLNTSGGPTDPFIGRRDDGSIDRLGYYDGFDHSELITNAEIICAVHSWLAQWSGNNHAPRDDTPTQINHPFDAGSSQTSLTITQANAHDDDGDALSHAWSVARTIPDAIAQMRNEATLMPIVTVDQPTNVLVWHTVRDGRGGIAVRLIDLFIPAAPPAGCSIGEYSVSLTPDFQGVIHWNMIGTGCLSQDFTRVSLWTDPTNDETRLAPTADRIWPHRRIAVYGQGPSINSGPSVFSNVEMTYTITTPRIP